MDMDRFQALSRIGFEKKRKASENCSRAISQLQEAETNIGSAMCSITRAGLESETSIFELFKKPVAV
jgi:hypothetical protein